MDHDHATVCMSGCKPNHGLYLWFPLLLYDGGSGLRLNDGADVKPSSMGQSLVFVFGWAHRGSTKFS